ncbi:arginase family protein [Nanoarchaeota archaeon]
MRVIKLPFNAGSLKHKNGLEQAPGAIQDAVKQFYMNESGFLPMLDFEDVGVDNSNIDGSHAMIENKIASVEHFSAVLGGDHSVTMSSFKGFARNKQNPGLIVFDAHPDLMESFGTHEDYLRTLIEKGDLKPSNVILVGLRNAHSQELSYMKQKGIKSFSMKELAQEGLQDSCDAIMAAARDFSDLYVSIDIDVLDPAFAPGVSYREPGGLSVRELLYFVHRLKNLKNWRMADIVEVNVLRDVSGLTVKAGAKVLVELA